MNGIAPRRLLLIFGATMALVVALAQAPRLHAATLDDSALRDAVRFRTDVGFDTSTSIVEASFGDPSYSSEEWGIPLSRAELDNIAARSHVREAVQPAFGIARTQGGFAGVFIDQKRNGLPVFLSTDATGLRAVLDEVVPKGILYETRQVARSTSDLESLQLERKPRSEAVKRDSSNRVHRDCS
jgi:hypothetical protein